jgi:hypothetical protein
MKRTSGQPACASGSERKGFKRISPPESGRRPKVLGCPPEFIATIGQRNLPFLRLHQAEFADLSPDVAGVGPISLPVVLTKVQNVVEWY